MIKQIINGIKIVFQDSSSYKIAIASSLAIAYLFYWLLYKVTTIGNMIQMTKDGEFGKYSYAYFATYWIATLATALLFGISTSILVWLWRHSLLSKAGAGSSGLGAFIGALGAACPVCGAFLLSLLGVSAGVSILPLQGLELNFLSLGLIGASTVFAAQRVTKAVDCGECANYSHFRQKIFSRPTAQASNASFSDPKAQANKVSFVYGLAALFLLNQLLIGQIITSMELVPRNNFIASLLNIKTASTTTIIAPKLNPDGRTTSLVEQPTISEVPANPNTGNALADAKVVMIAAGKPFYAPDDIAFDDPINAQKKWGAFEKSISLTGHSGLDPESIPLSLETRYQKLISTMVCSYCCGGPTNVTTINRCGCQHAKAARGFFKFMLQHYGDKYSDDQLLGEAHRWYAIWYPKGMLEDYLLATGKDNALPHKTHGGAGADGRHGL